MCRADYFKRVCRKLVVAMALSAVVMAAGCGKDSSNGGSSENTNIQASVVADVNSDTNLSDKTQNAGETAATEATDSTVGNNENVTEETTAESSGSTGEGSETNTDSSNVESASDVASETVADNENSQQGESVTESTTESATEAPTQPKKTVICLDPGHGGESQGTHYTYDGVEIEEKNLNYYIAKRLKSYLEQYDDIEVVIDRGENVDPSFEERIAFAVENNADLIVSLHNNSKSRDDIEPKGCMAITTCSRYQAESAVNDDVYGTSRALALSILSSLKNIGLSITIDWDANKTNGILQRVGAGTYPDGSASDYYGLIRNATSAGIPSVIIEHAFLSNESDYRKFLSSNAKLDALAKADAAGIVNYLNSR
jgi:N-acetylmuramoyl-L-alanine amidase